MTPHDELDLLSAYIDGELDEQERTRLEAHLPTCAECRTTLDALRATLADLAALPEPAPTEQDSWALRSALARARKPVRRWQRAAIAASSVAAAAVAVLAFALSGGGGDSSLDASRALNREALEGAGGGPGVPIVTSSENFSIDSAHTYLLRESGKVPADRTITDARKQTALPAAAGAAAPTSQEFSALSSISEDVRRQLDRCVAVVQRSTQELLTPFRYEIASFESKPAFLLLFSTRERFELWVVSRDRCEVLYFAQTA